MSHVANIPTTTPLKQSFSNGQLSKNAQVSGYKGHPNPTLAALISNGTIRLDQINGITVVGWGGE